MRLLAVLVATILPALPATSAEVQAENGVVAVRVLYRGFVPPPAETKVVRDAEICGTVVTRQTVKVHPPSGGLGNAVVAIEGLRATETNPPATPPPVALSNYQCQFTPHIMPIRVGTAIEIRNQDPIMHNTHIKHDVRTFINVAMVANARPIAKRVEKPGLYRVQCDAHKFMQGYVIASEHPYVGVSDDRGHVSILHVPAGTHDISAWHESLGELHAQVTVPANGEVTVTFEFPQDGFDHGRRTNK